MHAEAAVPLTSSGGHVHAAQPGPLTSVEERVQSEVVDLAGFLAAGSRAQLLPPGGVAIDHLRSPQAETLAEYTQACRRVACRSIQRLQPNQTLLINTREPTAEDVGALPHTP